MRQLILRWLPCVLVPVAAASSCARFEPPDKEELRQFPRDANLPGTPPASGLRYWQGPLTALPYAGSYVSVIVGGQSGPGQLELWRNTWGEPGAAERAIVVRRGPSIERLGPATPVLDGRAIDDVPDVKQPEKLSPTRGFTRPSMTWYPDIGYVLMACVCPDYKPGSVPLIPVVCTSKTGEPGTWRYGHKITGDLAEMAKTKTIWCDGGGIVRLPDGRWRMYLNGTGQVVASLESDTLDGPWRFLRDAKGGIRDLLPDFPRAPGRDGVFPTVLQVARDEWHLWIVDKWPPQCVLHYWSTDGLAWRPYGVQPEITRAAVNGRGIKCLRTFVEPDGKHIGGLLSVWCTQPDGKKEWTFHYIRMPVGPPPGAGGK
jgi:hypothetical protein